MSYRLDCEIFVKTYLMLEIGTENGFKSLR